MLNTYDKKIPFFEEDEYNPIEFTEFLHPRILIKPIYFELKFSNDSRILGRKAVLNRLIKAVELLPKQYGLQLLDVYRCRAVQAKLFDWMSLEVRKRHPDYSEEQHYIETKKFVSEASKVGDSYCPPHLSGGAVDLTLFDIEKNQAFNMGTPFDDCSEQSYTNYYETNHPRNAEEVAIKARRDLLKQTMAKVGFTNYHYEWWHYDVGNVFWSRETGKQQAFGPLFGDNEDGS